MAVHFSRSDIDNIIEQYTSGVSMNKIGKLFGVGDKPIKRVLTNSGVIINDSSIKRFTTTELGAIYAAYDSGIGANGIPEHLGIECSCSPIIRVLKAKYGKLRDRSKQQQARMDKSTPEQKASLVKAANNAARGRVATRDEKVKRANTKEGKIRSDSVYEAAVLSVLSDNFDNVIPAKAIDIYNADFAIGNVTVEVFGGGWSYSDKTRVDRYVSRTKEIAKAGFSVVFIILTNRSHIGNFNKLIERINDLSINPASASEYRVIWGDRDGDSGLCCDINNGSFVCPFVNSIDPTTGRYVSIPR